MSDPDTLAGVDWPAPLDLPAAELVPKPSPGVRLTLRQRRDIALGYHPLTGRRLHPDADPTGTLLREPGDPVCHPDAPTCGSCAHRHLVRYHNRTYPKCARAADTHGAATDCRAWWPACTLWVDRDAPRCDDGRQGRCDTDPCGTCPERTP